MPSRERERSRSRIRTRVLVAVLIASMVTVSFIAAILIPLYSYPGVDWTAIVQAKEANPSVAMVVIINPDNGPGQSKDQNYVQGVNSLRSAGVVVLGYDHTSYAARPLSDVIADINSYKSWYNINGIFFDEMSNVPGNENYYTTLNQYTKSIGLNLTVGNPGSSIPASYLGTLDVIVTYENQGVPDSSSLASITNGMPKNDFAVIAYGADQFNASAVSNIFNYASYVYVTNNTLPNPYGALTGDFSKLVSLLANPNPVSVPLNVKSVNAAGTPIVGLLTSITSINGSAVASGNTPLTYSVSSGAGYVVSVANYGGFVFDHWNDGSTNPVMTLTVTQGTTLTAYFSASQTNTSTSSTTSTSVSTTSTISSSTSTSASTTTSFGSPTTVTSTTITTDTATQTVTSTSAPTTQATTSIQTITTSQSSTTPTTLTSPATTTGTTISKTTNTASTAVNTRASPSLTTTYVVLATITSALIVSGALFAKIRKWHS